MSRLLQRFNNEAIDEDKFASQTVGNYFKRFVKDSEQERKPLGMVSKALLDKMRDEVDRLKEILTKKLTLLNEITNVSEFDKSSSNPMNEISNNGDFIRAFNSLVRIYKQKQLDSISRERLKAIMLEVEQQISEIVDEYSRLIQDNAFSLLSEDNIISKGAQQYINSFLLRHMSDYAIYKDAYQSLQVASPYFLTNNSIKAQYNSIISQELNIDERALISQLSQTKGKSINFYVPERDRAFYESYGDPKIDEGEREELDVGEYEDDTLISGEGEPTLQTDSNRIDLSVLSEIYARILNIEELYNNYNNVLLVMDDDKEIFDIINDFFEELLGFGINLSQVGITGNFFNNNIKPILYISNVLSNQKTRGFSKSSKLPKLINELQTLMKRGLNDNPFVSKGFEQFKNTSIKINFNNNKPLLNKIKEIILFINREYYDIVESEFVESIPNIEGLKTTGPSSVSQDTKVGVRLPTLGNLNDIALYLTELNALKQYYTDSEPLFDNDNLTEEELIRLSDLFVRDFFEYIPDRGVWFVYYIQNLYDIYNDYSDVDLVQKSKVPSEINKIKSNVENYMIKPFERNEIFSTTGKKLFNAMKLKKQVGYNYKIINKILAIVDEFLKVLSMGQYGVPDEAREQELEEFEEPPEIPDVSKEAEQLIEEQAQRAEEELQAPAEEIGGCMKCFNNRFALFLKNHNQD